jgi:hypothetical protein
LRLPKRIVHHVSGLRLLSPLSGPFQLERAVTHLTAPDIDQSPLDGSTVRHSGGNNGGSP